MKYEITNNAITIYDTQKYTTIEDFLNTYKQSRKNKYLFIQNKQILLDDQPVKNIQAPIHNKPITIIRKKEEVDWKTSEAECSIIHQNPFLLVVHKDAGCIIHGEENDTTCLNAQVARFLLNHDMHTTVRPLHRLDKETTGLVLYSLIPFFQPWFDNAMENKQIYREYLAIVYGKKKVGEKFDCRASIGRDRHDAKKYRVSKNGKQASTHFDVIAQIGPYNLIHCVLDTGRTHQIRVHLSYLGLPIVNDALYGKSSKDFKKMGLWAQKITFFDPISEKIHKFSDKENPDYSFFMNQNSSKLEKYYNKYIVKK